MSDDLVKKALVENEDEAIEKVVAKAKKTVMSEDEEAERSDQLAETLTSLQNLIERHALELTRISGELREKRQAVKNVFDNDFQLVEKKEEVDKYNQEYKERKSQLQNDPQVIALKVDVSDLNQQKKELEETLSNHLVNYHSLTNSTSFDTSEGDQWEFAIKAKIKTKTK
jgi:DNA repair exonuclease SbcCD ATPase subunit